MMKIFMTTFAALSITGSLKAEILLPDPSVFVENGTYYLVGAENGDASRIGTGPRHGDAVFPVYVPTDPMTMHLL